MGPVSNHIYFRELDPLGNDALSKIARRIKPSSRVLDLGCGPGVLGERLTKEKRCLVDGIEGNPAAAALAAERMNRVVVADLEDGALATHLGAERYDFIVCADVIEHLRRPEAVLTQLTALLRPEGRVLLSIPNVGYAGLVGALLNGDFRYRSEGLLDETHLRFFTRASLDRFLERCAFQVVHRDIVALPIGQSEFAADELEMLPPAVLRTLLAGPDALTYQFVTELAPAGSVATAPTAETAKAPAFTYITQLYHRGPEPFEAARCSTAVGEMVKERQTLRLTIPPSTVAIQKLRLDPSNRPGYLRLYSMMLRSAGGELLWRWNRAVRPETDRSHQLRSVDDADDEGLLLVCEGDDPWWELSVPAGALAALGAAGGMLEVELSWPQSPSRARCCCRSSVAIACRRARPSCCGSAPRPAPCVPKSTRCERSSTPNARRWRASIGR